MQLKAIVAAVAALVACSWSDGAQATRYFVDNTLGDVPVEQAVHVAEPKPVLLLIEFKSNGGVNAQARRWIAPLVRQLVTESGYFSEISTSPIEGGAILSIVIDNVFDLEAARQAHDETVATLGLRGNAVTDTYLASAEYSRGGDAPSIRKEARHLLITTVGNIAEPQHSTRVSNLDAALTTVVRQLVQRLQHDIVSDPAFTGAPVEAPAAMSPGTATAAAEPSDQVAQRAY